MLAKTNTSESIYLKTFPEILMLPIYEPIIPPDIAIGTQINICGERLMPDKNIPVNPAAEFTKINKADTAAVSFISAQCSSSNRGLKKIPPPTPIIPETNPRIAPAANPT